MIFASHFLSIEMIGNLMMAMAHPATETETTSLLKPKTSALNDLFQPVEATVIEVPIKGQERLEKKHKTTLDACRRLSLSQDCTRDCLTSNLLGSFTVLLYLMLYFIWHKPLQS